MAVETFKEFQKKTGDPLKGQTEWGYAYGVSGKIDKVNECLQLLMQREKRDKDVNLNMDFLVFLRTHPFGENIRKDPLFNELLIKAGFNK
ncbi:MAG: hypothetical protein O6940_00020 [Ignavibacteria bacterium]|nr:hypothetical protein [Ignavibacteria bacterium]